MWLIIVILLSGLAVGALGRLLVPGPNPMSLLKTTLVGIGGALLGGTVGAVVLHRSGSIVFAVLGAAAIVWWLERARNRQADNY